MRRWVYRVFPFVLALFMVLYLCSGFFTVKLKQRGIVKRFGRVVGDPRPAGLHYHFPKPIETAETVDTQVVRRLEAGFWPRPLAPETGEDAPEERRDEAVAEASLDRSYYCVTADKNIFHARVVLSYTISDPVAYLHTVVEPERMLTQVVNSAVLKAIGQRKMDEAHLDLRSVREHVLGLVNDRVHKMGLPLKVSKADIRLERPEAVRFAYQDVIDAENNKQEEIHRARDRATVTQRETEAKCNKILEEARAYRVRVAEHAEGEAQRFLALYAEYRTAKDMTRKRLYLEMAERTFPKIRKYIMPSDAEGFPLGIKLITGKP